MCFFEGTGNLQMIAQISRARHEKRKSSLLRGGKVGQKVFGVGLDEEIVAELVRYVVCLRISRI